MQLCLLEKRAWEQYKCFLNEHLYGVTERPQLTSVKPRQKPPTQTLICDLSVCRAQGKSLTPAAITHHCGQSKWVGFGMRQRGAGNCHGNRLTDSVAAVWVSVIDVG